MERGANVRLERIERLLSELEYEMARGIMQREIGPEMVFRRLLAGGPTGAVALSVYLHTVPAQEHSHVTPINLRLVD